jgi:hypothetical protein
MCWRWLGGACGVFKCLLCSNADICSAKGHVRFTPKSDMCSATQYVRFVPKADSCSAANRVAIRAFAVVRHSGVACVLQAKFDHR